MRAIILAVALLALCGCDFGVNALGLAIAVPAHVAGNAIGGAVAEGARGQGGVRCVTLTYAPGPCSVEATR